MPVLASGAAKDEMICCVQGQFLNMMFLTGTDCEYSCIELQGLDWKPPSFLFTVKSLVSIINLFCFFEYLMSIY